MNVVVICGVLSSDPVARVLPSGSTLVSLEVSTVVDDARVSVPVAWFDPPALPDWGAGDVLMVRGHVRRRFFHTGAGTQSRTELVAAEVVSATHRRGVAALLKRAGAALAQPVTAMDASPRRSAASA